MLPDEQHSKGFAMQSLMIGVGAVIASALPWMMSNWFGISNVSLQGSIPDSVKFSFYIGAVAFFGAVMYTIFTTKPYPPADIEAFRAKNKQSQGVAVAFKEIVDAIVNMPRTMRQVALVQFFTWPGLFLMWFYYSVAVAGNIFGGEPGSATYTEGLGYAGLTFSFYNLVTFGFALLIPVMAEKWSKKVTHALCLTAGGIGLISVGFVHTPQMLFLSMTGVGIAWASILSMPYAMLGSSLPKEKVGIYMGIFNFFIVLPEIIASLGFGWVMEHVLDNNRLAAVMIGGGLLLFAALLSLRVQESRH
jgi:maltose/moltooligosaccharide transporter